MSEINYYRYNFNFEYSCPLGQDVEDELRQASLEVFGSSYRKATRDEDLHKGTDCFIYGRPIDFTYAAAKKNKTVWFKRSYDADGIIFKFGIRFGNSKVNFKVPVLVVAVDVYDDAQMRALMNKIVAAYKKHAEKIINLGGYQYATWLYKHPDWKEGPKPRKKHTNRPRITSISYC